VNRGRQASRQARQAEPRRKRNPAGRIQKPGRVAVVVAGNPVAAENRVAELAEEPVQEPNQKTNQARGKQVCMAARQAGRQAVNPIPGRQVAGTCMGKSAQTSVTAGTT